jgi:Tfp pilus assembly protein PilV
MRACLASAIAAGRARLGAERGSALIEVMVGAILVAIASVAILNGLDGAQATGAKNKVRSVQATLAQQDIERMRSIPVTALSNLNQTRTVTVANVDYTVVSKTSWVSDRNGVVNCSDNAAQGEYLKLSSTVTSPASGSRPVTQTGLLTPTVGQLSASSGSATVKLTNRDGLPLAGVSVSLSGPSSRSATTNALGCAVFGYIPSGTYAVAVTGYVEIDSNPAADTLVVYPGRASFGQMEVDRAATVRANFVAPSGTTFITSAQRVWESITVKNANLVTGKRTYTRTTAPIRNTFVDGAGLFPYTDGVAVYAGTCAANDPSVGDPRAYSWGTSYFDTDAPNGWTALSPGDTQRNVNVEMPSLRVKVYRSNTTTNFVYASLRVTPTDAGCSAGIPTTTATFAGKRPHDFDMLLPFGQYSVCVTTRTIASDAATSRRATGTIDLRTPVPPTANRTQTLTTSGTSTTPC